MSVITINGPVGSGAIEVGQLVAQQLSLTYVDRLVLAEAAKLVHAPVGVLLDKEQRVDRFRDRLVYFLQTVLERSALQNAASVAAMVLTTESMITEIPQQKSAAPAMPPMDY